MKFKTAIFTLSASVAICQAQAVNISGVVKNSSGSGIEGVTVRLGKADIKSATGPDGNFTLKTNATSVKHPPRPAAFANDCPFTLQADRLFLRGADQAEVKVMVYDCRGRLLSSQFHGASQGNHSILLPHFSDGIQIYQVSMDLEQFVFKSATARAAHHRPLSSLKETDLAKQAKRTDLADDALLFTKEGYQLYRLAITNPETSGIQITMNPLVTGTVTDAGGNVYKTVQIGSQEWMAENLRTTKYNDNSGITKGSAYWFYGNTTDAAAQKKWGALYSWDAVKTGKLAPAGWHVPTDAEWDTLEHYLISNGYNYDGTLSENKIAKALSAKTDWQISTEPNALSNDLTKNNASGFSALPAGYRYYDGTFANQMSDAYWWSATQYDASYAWYRSLWYINFNLEKAYRVTMLGCSVRLVRNK
jgi:uncharacterized protein (TIGR02145 family)